MMWLSESKGRYKQIDHATALLVLGEPEEKAVPPEDHLAEKVGMDTALDRSAKAYGQQFFCSRRSRVRIPDACAGKTQIRCLEVFGGQTALLAVSSV